MTAADLRRQVEAIGAVGVALTDLGFADDSEEGRAIGRIVMLLYRHIIELEAEAPPTVAVQVPPERLAAIADRLAVAFHLHRGDA